MRDLHISNCTAPIVGSPGRIDLAWYLVSTRRNVIEDEPLLKCYFDLFKSVINSGGRKLLIIGYGFRDLHVNRILLSGVMTHGLELFIIHPKPPDVFKKSLWETMTPQSRGAPKKIWAAVRGYFPYSLFDVFHGNSDADTAAWREIKNSFHR